MSIIIGLAGEAGSGKDTVAEYLVNKHGYKQIAFADNLKKMCVVVFGLSNEQCYDQKLKEKKLAKPVRILPEHVAALISYVQDKNGFDLDDDTRCDLYKFVSRKRLFTTAREILQYVGTEILRETVRDDYHIEVVRRRIEALKVDRVVITDARFPNERKTVTDDWGGSTVLVDRPKEKTSSVGLEGHASENSLGIDADYDYIIDNSGSLEDLYETVEELALAVIKSE